MPGPIGEKLGLLGRRYEGFSGCFHVAFALETGQELLACLQMPPGPAQCAAARGSGEPRGHDRILNAKVRRAGYAVDTWLFYATGGVAFAHAKFSLAYTWGETTVSDKNTHVGWTVGAGIEKAFTPNLIGRLEARYTDFGKKTFDPFNSGGIAIRSDWHQASVTVGLSYKF